MTDTRALAHARGAMKIAEVALAVVCLVVYRHYNLSFGGTDTAAADRYIVGMVTFGGMLLISGPLLLAYIRNPAGIVNYYTPFLEVIYNLIGFVLFLTVGGLVLEHYKGHLKPLEGSEPGVALGAICLVNSIIYLIDASLAIKQGTE
ncbi:hypothetical protein GHT06_016729 [Daphnia sinensis]|uniref:MARVEL domain-containing protein n=1 Tax=Daphnia sinensis TaxID=1820382 RepID=A0AAD5PVE5_9CRUS|nr:hypothetical protein GHT06_016729 [Daphnia sinensis]